MNLVVNNGFVKKIISMIFSKLLKSKLGMDIKASLADLKVESGEERTKVFVGISLEGTNKDIEGLLKKAGLI